MTTRAAAVADKWAVLDCLTLMQAELMTLDGGGLVSPGEKTREWLGRCFDTAVSGRGACIVAERHGELAGVSLAFETEIPYDTKLGRTAFGVGTYVVATHRKCGVADSLYKGIKKSLLDIGFKSYVGGVMHENRAVVGVLRRNGARMPESVVVFDLGEEA